MRGDFGALSHCFGFSWNEGWSVRQRRQRWGSGLPASARLVLVYEEGGF